MKAPKSGMGNPIDLDQLSTQELEGLVRNDFLASHGQTDPEFVAAAMEVIARRKDQTTPTVDVDAAWETFRARMKQDLGQKADAPEAAPELPAGQETKKTGTRRWLRPAVAAAAVVAILVCLSLVPVQGTSLLQSFVGWTGDTFSFIQENNSAEESKIFSDLVYQQAKNSISNLTDQPVLPTWYPDGSSIIRVEENPMDNGYNYTIIFSLNNKEFLLSISIYQDALYMEDTSSSAEYEKNNGSAEEYYSNGIPHYLMGNLEQSSAVWRNNSVECSIHGYLSIDDLKKIIDSIYSGGN
ncbi:MAG TPA: DUF4367 domain-containing protein [Candidatus Evtepia faecigallinarum]|nr:DUF4367 domain-containing protein [Candidatus Evtepia faecigallinarum]